MKYLGNVIVASSRRKKIKETQKRRRVGKKIESIYIRGCVPLRHNSLKLYVILIKRCIIMEFQTMQR